MALHLSVRRGNRSVAAHWAMRSAILAALVGTSAFADTAATYTGLATGNWSTPGNWSTGLAPNNGNGGQNFLVIIDGNAGQTSTVNQDGNFAIDGLNVTSGDALNILNNNQLTIVAGAGIGSILNNGTISFSSGGNTTGLLLNGAGTVSLSGSGVLTDSDNANNRIVAAVAGITFSNSSNILMAGYIDNGNGSAIAVNNSGAIAANSTNNALIVSPCAGLINTGILEGGNGTVAGVLQLSDANFNNAGGTILANAGSAVVLVNASIVGGTLSTSGSGVIQTGGGNFASQFSGSMTLTASSTLNIVNNSGINLAGGSTLTNNGAILLSSGGNNTQLNLVGSGTMTLAGSGVVSMGNNGNNRIVASATGLTLLNLSTIQGAGYFDNGNGNALAVNNQGTITANSTNNALIVSPRAGLINAGGILQAGDATHTGVLQINDATFTNTGGTITANPGSAVLLVGNLSVIGGILSTSGSGVIQTGGGQFNPSLTGPLMIGANSTFNLVNNSGINLFGGSTYTNNGTVSLMSAGNTTQLTLNTPGTVTLTGTGLVTLSDNAANRIIANNTGMTFVNMQSIQGAGHFGNGEGTPFTLANAGTITALGVNALIPNPGAGVINTGVLQAGDGTHPGVLVLQNDNFTNNRATIVANQGSTVLFDNGSNTIGGTLQANGTGSTFQTGSGHFGPTWTGPLTIAAGTPVNIVNNSGVNLLGGSTYTNNGTIALQSAGNTTEFQLNSPGTVTLTGSGLITLSDNAANRVIANNTGMTFVNTQSIQGAGHFGNGEGNAYTLANAGTITAFGGNPLIPSPGAGVINTGVLQAGNGVGTGVLVLQNDSYINNNGIIVANQGSTVVLNNGSNIIGGTLQANGTGSSFQLGSGHFGPTWTGPLTIAAATPVNIVNNSGINLLGGSTYTNNGTIALQSAGNTTEFQLNTTGTVTLTGSGLVTFTDNANNRIIANSTGMTFIVAKTQSIQGAGHFGNGEGNPYTLANAGTITALGGNPLIVSPGAGFINTGLLRAGNGTGTGVLVFQNDSYNNGSGTILANQGSTVVFNNGSNTIGGILQANGTGSSFQTGGGQFSPAWTGPLTIAAGTPVNITNNSGVNLFGQSTYINNGSIALQSGGNTTELELNGAGIITLAGTGSVTLSNNSNNRVIANVAGLALDNTAGQTIQGGGHFGNGEGASFDFTNEGSLLGNNGNLIIAPGGTTTSTGTVRASGGGLTFQGGIFNMSGIIDSTNGGALTFGSGNTTLTSPVTLSGNSSVNFSAGTQSITTITGTGAVNVGTGALLTSNAIFNVGPWTITGTQIIRSGLGNAGTMKRGDVPIVSNGTGQLNIGDNKLIVEASSAADKASKIATLNTEISAGANGSTWTGHGITSSTVIADTVHLGIGVFDNAILGLTSFGGSNNVDAGSILVAVSHLGDANHNGIVDIQDLTIVANNWQQPRNNWAQGDLNRDNIVDIQDFTIVANNWQQTSSFNQVVSQLDAQGVLGGISAAVPEPGSLAMLALGGASLLVRKRRKS